MRKYFSHFFLAFSFLLISYVFFKSEIQWEGEKRNYYFIYYLLSIACLGLSFISFYLDTQTKLKILLFMISSFIPLYLIETFLVINKEYLKKKRVQIYQEITGNTFDQRSILELIKDEQIKNESIFYTGLYPHHFLSYNKIGFLPLSGTSNTQTIFCNENGNYTIYKSDRYGFNNNDKNWDKNNIEYLLLGDSYVHGACVNRPNDITSQLILLSNKNSINLSFNGNGPLIELATLKEFFPNEKKVKNILWFYYEGNDLAELNSELNNSTLVNYLDNENFSQNLIKNQKNVDKFLNEQLSKELAKMNSNSNLVLIKTLKLYELRLFIRNFFKKDIKSISEKDFFRIMDISNKFAKKNKVNFYFIYLPDILRYFSKNYNEDNYKIIKDILIRLEIPIIDIKKEIEESQIDPKKFFPLGQPGHFNEFGYNFVAKKILKLAR